MAKRKKLKGQYLMLFINDLPVALATSSTHDVNLDTDTTNTKDSAGWDYPEYVGGNWQITSDSVVSSEETGTVDQSYEQLLDIALNEEQVTVKWGKLSTADQAESSVPDTGWTVPLNGYTGSAIITAVSLTAGTKENATMSITLAGQGKPEKYTTP